MPKSQQCFSDPKSFSGKYGNKLEEAAVIDREENNLRRRIQEALEILGQSLTLNRDREFELPALYKDVLANNLVYPS